MEEEFKNRVTLCIKHRSMAKPSNDVGIIQTKRYSSVTDVDAGYLATFLVNGHSVHAAVCNMKTDNKSEATAKTFRKESFLYQNVFMLDLDHGNFSREEVLKRSLVKPSIIYQSYSSCEGGRRWRVVYFADVTITEATNSERVNKLLTTPFMENLEDYHAENVDLNAVDATRIFYCGKKEELYVDDKAFFNPYDLLNDSKLKERHRLAVDKVQPFKIQKRTRNALIKKAKEKKLITEEEYNTYCNLKESKIATLERYNELNDWGSKCEELIRSKLKDENQKRKHKKNKVETKSLEVNDSTGEVLEPVEFGSLEELKATIMSNLSHFNPTGIKEMTYDEANRFLAKLPLHKLLGVRINQNFKCVFHDDKSPSATVFDGKNGMSIYKCHSESCAVSLNTHSFLMLLMSSTSNGLRANNIQELLKPMKIKLVKNEFEIYAKLQLSDSSSYLSTLPDNDPLKKRLMKNNLHELYYALVRYAHTLVTDEPLKKYGDEVVIHASLSELHKFMRNDKVRGTSNFTTFKDKLKFLGVIGLFVPVAHQDLKPEYYHVAIKNKKNESHKLKSFYQFPVFDIFSHDSILEKVRIYDESGAKLDHLTSTQILIVLGADEAKKNYVQNKKADQLTNKQKKLLEQMINEANKLMEKQKFFTHEQLIRKVDTKCKLYPNKTARFNASVNLMILLKRELNVNEVNVNRANRKKYNIPEKFPSRDVVYFLNDLGEK